MEYLVDTQGFQQPINEFVLKELATIPLHVDLQPMVFLFKPPTDWCDLPAKYKSVNLWLERNYHHLPWTSGELPYEDVENVLRSVLHNASTVYVKGEQKKKWLEQFGFNVRDIIDCPSLKTFHSENVATTCPHHHDLAVKTHCALRNVQLLKKFLRDNIPSLERSIKLFHRIGNLSFMEPSDIAQLPKEFIVTFAANSIELAWDKLPETLKQDPEVADCLRCREHFPMERGLFIPMKRECLKCINSY